MGVRIFISADKKGRNRDTESAARKEKKLMTELRAICSACATLNLPLAVRFVYHESEPYSCQSRAEQGGESRRRTAREEGRSAKSQGEL